MENSKLVSLSNLLEKIETYKNQGKKIVFTNGCFDILHVGHIRYLKDASKYGDIVITAINSDKSVKQLKGNTRPYYPENERAEILCSLEMINYVIIFNEFNVSNLLLQIKPDFHAKGTDYTEDTVPEKEIMSKIGGKVIICGDAKDHSSTNIIRRIDK